MGSIGISPHWLHSVHEHVPTEQQPFGLNDDGHGPMADVMPFAKMNLTSGLQQPLSVVHVDYPLQRVLKGRIRTQHVVVVCNSVCACGKSVLA